MRAREPVDIKRRTQRGRSAPRGGGFPAGPRAGTPVPGPENTPVAAPCPPGAAWGPGTCPASASSPPKCLKHSFAREHRPHGSLGALGPGPPDAGPAHAPCRGRGAGGRPWDAAARARDAPGARAPEPPCRRHVNLCWLQHGLWWCWPDLRGPARALSGPEPSGRWPPGCPKKHLARPRRAAQSAWAPSRTSPPPHLPHIHRALTLIPNRPCFGVSLPPSAAAASEIAAGPRISPTAAVLPGQGARAVGKVCRRRSTRVCVLTISLHCHPGAGNAPQRAPYVAPCALSLTSAKRNGP